VVQAREVRDLDDLGGRQHVVVDPRAEVRGEQQQQRPRALAARLQEVARHGIRDRVGDAQVVLEARLEVVEAAVDAVDDAQVGGRRKPRPPEPEGLSDRRHQLPCSSACA
jgi:hypothetical protein